VVHSGIRNYGKSLLQLIRGASFQSRAQFVLPLSGLATIAVSELRPNGTHSGTAPAAGHFPATHYEWPKAKRASISARVGRLRPPERGRSMPGYGGVDFIDLIHS